MPPPIPEKKAPAPQEKTDVAKKPDEKKMAPGSKEAVTHAETRGALLDLQDKEGLGKIKTIQDRKKAIETERQQLEAEASSKRSKESWTNLPDGSTKGARVLADKLPGETSTETIKSSVEEAFKEDKNIQDLLKRNGLDDDTNGTVMKNVLMGICSDFMDKLNSSSKPEVKAQTTNYIKGSFMTKVQFLFDELAKVFESKKTPFTKPIELLENFGLFTKTNILHNGFLQAQQLKEFFLLEKSNYEIFINNFRKSFDLDAEKKTLDGQEVELLGKKIDPATLFKEKRFKLLNKARITTPKETKDLDKTLQEEILKVLPPIADPEIKEKITSYLMGEVKKLNPQPDQIFELSPEGQWFKVEATSEQKPKTETPEKAETPEKVKEQEKEKAKEEALKKAEEVSKGEAASTSTNPSTPADFFKDGMKNFSEIILQLINYFLEFIGAKKPDMMQELVKEWKNTIAQDELKMLKEMYGSGRNFFKKMDNIHKLIKDQDETRRVFAARKADTLPNETWNQWIQRHLSEQEQEEINTSTTIEPKKIADYLISQNNEEDKPPVVNPQAVPVAGQQPSTGPTGPASK